jgi:hypothetical protein
MVKFELSEILDDSDLSTLIDDINDLGNKLSIKTLEYTKNTKNQTIGVTPDQGLSIVNLPSTDKTASFIDKLQVDIQEHMDDILPTIYVDNVWQVLMATQTIPIGWLYNNVTHSNYIYNRLFATWKTIFNGNLSWDIPPLYPLISSFGIMIRNLNGKPDMVFFAICDNQVDSNNLQNYKNDSEIDNLVIITEEEYTDKLLNGSAYKFTVRFDKSISAYSNGVVFKAKTKLISSIPSYTLKVICSNSMILYKDTVDRINNPHVEYIDFKKGADVSIIARVPSNFDIYMVSLNGTTYYNGTYEMSLAGISITELDAYTLTGYKTYSITASKLLSNSSIYIAACEDLTKSTTNKSMISSTSSLNVTDEDISINLVFKRPFIYLDTSKVKVYATKVDGGVEELISNVSYIMNGQQYRERTAVFKLPNLADPTDNQKKHQRIISDRTKYINDKYHNPYVSFNRPNKYTDEPKLVSHSIIYGVDECGSLILTFDGYSHYKYFRVEFEDKAMVATIKIPGSTEVDCYPYIEETRFTNEYYDTVVDDDDNSDPNDVNNDGLSDNNTIPDQVIAPGVGFSFDE